MKKATLLTTLAVVLAATSIASAGLIHESTERYYDNGTEVTVATGGTDFVVGDISSGVILWEVLQKGFWNLEEETTTITYTVGNDSFSDPITSFHAPLPMTPISWSTGEIGWDVEVFADEIVWATDDPQYGIPLYQTKNKMTVVFDGLWNVGWAPGAMADFADGTLLSNDNWVVSAVVVPAPGALLLGILGMGGIGWIKRRIS
jgi:hypothetical protein